MIVLVLDMSNQVIFPNSSKFSQIYIPDKETILFHKLCQNMFYQGSRKVLINIKARKRLLSATSSR